MISFKEYKFEFPKEATCPVCGKKLHNPESLVAGIGPVCHKKIKFAENIPHHLLLQCAHFRKNPFDAIKQNKTLILKNNVGVSFIAHIIYVNKDSQMFLYLDRSAIHKDCNEKKLFLSDIYYKNIKQEHLANIDFVSEIDVPQTPDLRREYFLYNKEYSMQEKALKEIHKEMIDRGLFKAYQIVNSKEDMTEYQRQNREQLLQFKENTSEVYQHMWDNGFYQKATFLARIKNLKTKESIRLYEYMEKSLNNEIIIKDYGLTDDEIVNGFKHSSKKYESILFSAYISGNRNIMLMISLCEKIPELSIINRTKVLKSLINMSKNNYYTKEDLKRDLV
jgi:hypothetical protein